MKRLALLSLVVLAGCEKQQPPAACGSIPEVTVNAGETATVTVCFTDPNGDALAYSAKSSNSGVATASVSGTGITVAAVAPGSASVTVTASDPGGLEAEQSFQVVVPNRAPQAEGTIPPLSVIQTVTVDVSAYFTEPDGETLTYSAASSDPAVATASVSGDTVTVAAVARGGTDVTVTAEDPGGLAATQTFRVTVPNRAPEAGDTIPDMEVVAGDTVAVDVSEHFADPDGDTLTYSAASSDPAVATASVSGDTVTVAAVARGGTDVTVTAEDPGGLAATQTFRVTVPNRAPEAGDPIPDMETVAGDTVAVDVSEHFADPDGDTLTYSAASSDPAVATASVSGDTVTVAAVARGGTDVTVTAEDPGGLAATQTFRVTVPNRAPEAGDTIPDMETVAGDTVAVDVSEHFADPDGDTLTYSAASSDPAVATASVSGDTVTVAAVARGGTDVTVTAEDPGGLAATQTFRVTVPNRAPEAGDTIPDMETVAGDTVAVDVSEHFADPDGDTLTYSAASSDPAVATASVSGDTVTVAAVARGGTDVTVTAEDPGGLAATQTFRVTVPNRAPEAGDPIPDMEAVAGDTVAVDVSEHFADPDGDTLTYSAASSDPAVATASVSGGTVSVAAMGLDTATLTVTATDPDGLSAQTAFGVTVRSPDRAVLDALYEATGGPDWHSNDGWLTDAPINEWHGVSVDETGRVDSLNLGINGLTGSIPPELADLTNLTVLDLGFNGLTGSIPPETGNLPGLEVLDLRGNGLEGSIPAELADLTNLTVLDLGFNGLTGSIPPETGNLSGLEVLDLRTNDLTGSIPAELGDLTNLTVLDLGFNGLTGSIPPETGDLSGLEVLDLQGNGLEGSIPAELGDLTNLTVLDLGFNDLSGPLPPELGNLIAIVDLRLQHNPDLEGLLPRSILNLSPVRLDASGTDLCAQLDDEFQEWLATIEEVRMWKCPATQIERLALSELYASTGGDSWTDNDGWSSDSEVGDWYGVTVGDSLVQQLRLPDNGLEGPLPPELGSLQALETLDLADNDLTGGFAAPIASIDLLDTIRIGDNPDMEGYLPHRMIDLENLRVLQYADTDLCAPPGPTFQEWIDSLDVADGATCGNPDEVRLSLPIVYLTQAIQRPEGDVSLLSNREALLRVFLVGDEENAFFEPEVFATFTRDGKEVHRVVMPSEHYVLPTSADEGDLIESYNAVIPARHIVDGTEFVIVADSAEVVPRAPGSQTRFPETGSEPLDVIEVPPLELTVVPVLNADNPDSSIFEWTDNIDDDSPEVGLLKYSFPFSEFTATSWDTAYVTDLDLTIESNTWRLVLELAKVYEDEEATGYWYAVADSEEGYVRGIAIMNGWVSFGKPWDTELAHEVGHSLDLPHAPCGGAKGTDPDFPYENGSIGMWGYDFRDSTVVSPGRRRDIMGYCYDLGWLSDYYFEKVIRVREEKEGDDSLEWRPGAGPRGPALVLWGGVLDGELRIEPVHAMYTTAKLPQESGPYRLDGIARNGDVEFSLSFAPDEDVYGNKYFFFTIPIADDWEHSLERITLTGPEGEVTVDDSDPRSLTVVTDPATGRIRAILHDWDRALPAALGDTDGLQVVTTRGIAEAVRLR